MSHVRSGQFKMFPNVCKRAVSVLAFRHRLLVCSALPSTVTPTRDDICCSLMLFNKLGARVSTLRLHRLHDYDLTFGAGVSTYNRLGWSFVTRLWFVNEPLSNGWCELHKNGYRSRGGRSMASNRSEAKLLTWFLPFDSRRTNIWPFWLKHCGSQMLGLTCSVVGKTLGVILVFTGYCFFLHTHPHQHFECTRRVAVPEAPHIHMSSLT